MERVSIPEASRRLRITATSIRQCIRDGELNAYRLPGPDGRLAWVVELPAEGWTSAAMILEMERSFSPWWWADANRSESVHYVKDLATSAFEEIVPRFLCGLISEGIFTANDVPGEELCPECLAEARMLGLPLSLP
jgi:hypothetical protein